MNFGMIITMKHLYDKPFLTYNCNKKCPILPYKTQGLHVKSDIFIL